MAKKQSWWTQKAFSTPDRKSNHTRAAKPGEGKQKVEKCGACRQSLLKCKCRDARTFPAPPEGAKKSQGKKAPTQTDSNGIVWCTTCNMRVHPNGLCSNVTCSTRR